MSLKLGWDREHPLIFTIEDVAKIDPIRSKMEASLKATVLTIHGGGHYRHLTTVSLSVVHCANLVALDSSILPYEIVNS